MSSLRCKGHPRDLKLGLTLSILAALETSGYQCSGETHLQPGYESIPTMTQQRGYTCSCRATGSEQRFRMESLPWTDLLTTGIKPRVSAWRDNEVLDACLLSSSPRSDWLQEPPLHLQNNCYLEILFADTLAD